jgi:hypothetical protein
MALSEYAGKVLYFMLLSLVFAGIYMSLGHEQFNGMDESSNFFDYWYFSFTTFSTVGYGDISPKSGVAKAVVVTQQVILLLDLVDDFLGLGTSSYKGIKNLYNKVIGRTNLPINVGSSVGNTPVRSSPMRRQMKYDSLINDIKESRPIDALNVTA